MRGLLGDLRGQLNMNAHELDHLMHAVLDGEASPEEARELDRLLAADPAARARFDDLKRLFGELGSVPKALPPGGTGGCGDGEDSRSARRDRGACANFSAGRV